MFEIILIVIGILLLLFLGIFIGCSFKRREFRDKTLEEGDLKHYLQAMELAVNNDFDMAINVLERQAERFPSKLFLHLALGNFYREKGQYEKSIRIHQGILSRVELGKALAGETYFALGLDYKKAGFIDRGINAFKKVLKLDKNNAICYKYLKELYEDSNDWEEAFECEVKILKLTNSRTD